MFEFMWNLRNTVYCALDLTNFKVSFGVSFLHKDENV